MGESRLVRGTLRRRFCYTRHENGADSAGTAGRESEPQANVPGRDGSDACDDKNAIT